MFSSGRLTAERMVMMKSSGKKLLSLKAYLVNKTLLRREFLLSRLQ